MRPRNLTRIGPMPPGFLPGPYYSCAARRPMDPTNGADRASERELLASLRDELPLL